MHARAADPGGAALSRAKETNLRFIFSQGLPLPRLSIRYYIHPVHSQRASGSDRAALSFRPSARLCRLLETTAT